MKSRKKRQLANSKPVGGRGWLSEGKIKQAQKYYGQVIHQNTVKIANPSDREVNIIVYTMKNNNIAILPHSVESENPTKEHHFCPAGKLYWCKWQQHVATGIKTYKGDDCFPEVYLKLLHPTFVTLTDSKLLEICQRS